MTAPVHFTVPGKPCGVNATHTGGRRPFVKSREARRFAQDVALHGFRARRLARWQTTTEPVEVAIRVVFDSERPDTDGPVKAILDALQTPTPRGRVGAGFVANDRQVRRYTVERVVDRENPRVEVVVAHALPRGEAIASGGGAWAAIEDAEAKERHPETAGKDPEQPA